MLLSKIWKVYLRFLRALLGALFRGDCSKISLALGSIWDWAPEAQTRIPGWFRIRMWLFSLALMHLLSTLKLLPHYVTINSFVDVCIHMLIFSSILSTPYACCWNRISPHLAFLTWCKQSCLFKFRHSQLLVSPRALSVKKWDEKLPPKNVSYITGRNPLWL